MPCRCDLSRVTFKIAAHGFISVTILTPDIVDIENVKIHEEILKFRAIRGIKSAVEKRS